MPATVKIKIFEARHLPIMDRSGETTDAFVEVKLASNIYKTEVCRRTLDPKWDSEWFRFEVNDEELQEEPLQIRVMDYDTYSSHDAIGRVYVDLTNMLMSENRSVFSGWLPIYDTLLGIRGELKIEVRLMPFCVDMKSFRHFSYNVLFFSSNLFPTAFRVIRVIGLVDHSLVADDPEHQWMDKIRTPRSTNEARQVLFMKMSGELRRKLGNKVADMGGNAVIALRQRIALGHIGVILRAVGTAAIVEKLSGGQQPTEGNDGTVYAPSPGGPRKQSKLDTVPGSPMEPPPLTLAFKPEDRRSMDVNQNLSAPAEVSRAIFGASAKFSVGGSVESDHSEPILHVNVYADFPFLTLRHLPAGVIKSLGGVVCCRMVKTLERLEQDDPNQASYVLWWRELRSEVLRHMKCIGCNAVMGYTEDLCLTDEGNIQLLSATGTAVVLDMDLSARDRDSEAMIDTLWGTAAMKENFQKESSILQYPEATGHTQDCKIYHLPMGEYADHVASTAALCTLCRIGHVPDILLSTIEVPDGSPIKGMGTLIQARVQRKTKALKGESGARELSEAMPFLEYDLHSQVTTKLKLLGCNVAFNLKFDVQCGTEVIVALAQCTGACVLSLPRPMRPTVVQAYKGSDSVDLQSKLDATLEQHLRQLGLTEEKDEKAAKVPRTLRSNIKKKKSMGSRQYSKSGFEVDLENEKSEGRDIISLIDYLPHKDTLLLGSEIAPMQDKIRQLRHAEFQLLQNGRSGAFIQNFCRVWRIQMMSEQDEMGDIAVICQHLLRDVVFRSRMYNPCRVSGLEFRLHMNTNDELLVFIQGSIVAEPLPLYTIPKGAAESRRVLRNVSSRTGLSESEDNANVPSTRLHIGESMSYESLSKDPHNVTALRVNPLAPSRPRISPPRPSQIFFQNQTVAQNAIHPHVEISSLSFIHTGAIKRYVGNLNMVVLRESQALRDNDGLSGFLQRALADFYAMVRAQTLASGGNTILSFQIAQLQLADSYNQAQCIIHASGDMVEVEAPIGAVGGEP